MDIPTPIRNAMEDPGTTDLGFSPGEAWQDRGRGVEPLSLDRPWCGTEIKAWLLEQLSATGKTWDARFPFIDLTLSTGHRLHAALPPASPLGPVVSLRRTALCTPRLLSQEAWSKDPFYACLVSAFLAGRRILIAGPTGSGKTTLANALLGELPPHERLVVLEEIAEIAPEGRTVIRLLAKPATADGAPEISLRMLLRQSLRMRPDRIILGECRGPEVLDLFQALNSGHQGTLGTLHATSARDAIRRLELLAHLAPEGHLPSATLKDLIVGGVDLIAVLDRVNHRRVIQEVSQIAGREGDTILLRPVLRSQ